MSRGRTIHRFGVFELDPQGGELRREGLKVPLQELPLRLLTALVERAGEVVSRGELQDRLWGPGVFVDADAGLNTAVRRVREALGDDAANPRFVATVPRRGYRFLAPVERQEASPARSFVSQARWAIGVIALLEVALVGFVALRRGEPVSAGASDPPRQGAEHLGDDAALAREFVLRGDFFADWRTREGLEKAIAAYQSALAADPQSARAYSGLAGAYALLGVYDYWRPSDAFPLAERMARQALELDPDSSEAHLAMGMNAAIVDWDWAAARDHVQRSVDLDPDAATPHLWYGALLSALGEHDAGIAQVRRALELEPLSPVINTAFAWNLFLARRYDEALEATRKTVELAPDRFDVWDNLAWIQATMGNQAEAVEAWARADALMGKDPDGIRRGFRKLGLEPLIRGSIEEMLQRSRAGYQSPYDLVLLYTLIDDKEPALEWLERSFAEHETDLVGLGVDPRLDRLRDDPRFQEILGRLHLPPSPEEPTRTARR